MVEPGTSARRGVEATPNIGGCSRGATQRSPRPASPRGASGHRSVTAKFRSPKHLAAFQPEIDTPCHNP
jgi:hypothetical protein